MSSSQPKIPYRGTFRIFQSYPSRPLGPREKPALESEFVQIIPNDYRFYSTLDPSKQDIRVAILLPGTRESRLACVLGETSLTDVNHPLYEGLSYCWGDLSSLKTIDILHGLPNRRASDDDDLDPENIILSDDPFLKGVLGGFKIARYYRQSYSITANLECALHYLRNENFPRFLWIDAICINQGNVAEKTQQVGMMETIYDQTFQTVVWLDESTDPAMESSSIYCRTTSQNVLDSGKKTSLIAMDLLYT